MSKSRQQQSKRLWTLAVMFAAIFAAIMGGSYAVAQDSPARNLQPVSPVSQVRPATASARLIVISIPDRKLVLLQNGTVKRVYPVAVGKPTTPSPVGQFTIIRRISDPTYAHGGKVVAPGPKNPVGSRWMGLSTKGYGIHGTNEPGSIGKAASHGCIRMGKANLEELYELVEVGDTVEIHAQHDATVTMALGEALPALPTQPATVTPANPVLVAGNAAATDLSEGQ